jgi:hypothetical protein
VKYIMRLISELADDLASIRAGSGEAFQSLLSWTTTNKDALWLLLAFFQALLRFVCGCLLLGCAISIASFLLWLTCRATCHLAHEIDPYLR